jgi:hypothetical protein
MRKVILVETHSLVDVITNSSSELFVCDTDKSIGFVKTFLENALDTYNMGSETNIHFKQAFQEPYKIDESNVDEFIRRAVEDWHFTPWNWDVPSIKSSWDHKDKYFKEKGLSYKSPWDDKKNKAYNDKIEKEAEEVWEKYFEDWKAVNIPKIKEKVIGNVVIESTDDNSIPYPLFEMIEGVLNASRQHLG